MNDKTLSLYILDMEEIMEASGDLMTKKAWRVKE